MSSNFPITPPRELVDQWADASARTWRENGTYAQHEFALATQAARWGADTELEACCLLLDDRHGRRAALYGAYNGVTLRAVRRPQPPSLKQQALAKLPEHPENMASYLKLTPGEVATIRRALEALPDG